ncbi:MAG: serine/threonine protein kinase [Candidatus Eremiobacteraeota bacterium]|nr:serine/threonine protein kinase [Candidatus Eremiobacteraeota bacterium]
MNKQTTLINNRYLLKEVIGSGAFSTVYLAEDTTALNFLCALKEMDISKVPDEERSLKYDLFLRESQMLQDLKHPGIPTFFDFFILGDRMYLVTEYIRGENLETRLEREGKPLDEGEVLDIITDVLDILDYLHGKNSAGRIIYRDLKPSNIIVDMQCDVNIVDLATARVYKDGQEKDTVELGTPGYAAPEAYGKRQTDESADIYSVGAVMWKLLTNEEPQEYMFDFPPVSQFNPEVSPALVKLIERCLKPGDGRINNVKYLSQRIRIIRKLRNSPLSREPVKVSNSTFFLALIPLWVGIVVRKVLNRRTITFFLLFMFLYFVITSFPSYFPIFQKVYYTDGVKKQDNTLEIQTLQILRAINRYYFEQDKMPDKLSDLNNYLDKMRFRGDYDNYHYGYSDWNGHLHFLLYNIHTKKGYAGSSKVEITFIADLKTVRILSDNDIKRENILIDIYNQYEVINKKGRYEPSLLMQILKKYDNNKKILKYDSREKIVMDALGVPQRSWSKKDKEAFLKDVILCLSPGKTEQIRETSDKIISEGVNLLGSDEFQSFIVRLRVNRDIKKKPTKMMLDEIIKRL